MAVLTLYSPTTGEIESCLELPDDAVEHQDFGGLAVLHKRSAPGAQRVDLETLAVVEAPPAPASPAPPVDRLSDFALWTYLAGLTPSITEANLVARGPELVALGAVTQTEWNQAEVKFRRSRSFSRFDPDVLLMAQLLGVANNQAELDWHFQEAGAT